MEPESPTDMLIRHEGKRAMPYQDSLGVWTVGIGHNLSRPLSHAAIMQIFDDDYCDARNDCLHAFPWFPDLDEARQEILINMCFNLGLARLLKFKRMLKALEVGNYALAAVEMMESTWAQQVGKRALELANIMRGDE